MSQLPLGLSYEENPFKPEAPRDSGAYLEEQARILREQHNLREAGDTTFSWTKLIESTELPSYTLGSFGRFKHPDYGMIHARYVKFVTPAPGIAVGSPAGWAPAAGGFKWEASTTFATAAEVAGLQAAYEAAPNGHYGWLITEGINIQSVRFTGAGAPAVGDKVGWDSSGKIKVRADFIIGTVVTVAGLFVVDGTNWDIAPGAIRLGV